MKKIITLGFLIILQIAVFGKKVTGDISPIFDISPNGEEIILTVTEDNNYSIYIYSLKDKKMSLLINSKTKYLTRPVFSPKGDKIIYLSKSLTKQSSDIYLFDLKNKTSEKVTDGKAYITEAIFSNNGNEIIYCGAEYVGNYSPMARKAPHDLELYSIDINGNNQRKLTNLSAYSLNSISLSPKGFKVLCKIEEKNYNGIYTISLVDTSISEKITAINNPRPQIGSSFYSKPLYSNNSEIISFTAPYQLYILDLETKKCEEIWSTLGEDNMAMAIFSHFTNSDKNIIISTLKIENRRYSSNAELWLINLDTNKTEQILLKNPPS